MTLECTLVLGPGAMARNEPEEMSIAVPDGTPGAHVQALLTAARATGRLHVDGQDISLLTVGEPPLVAGAILVDGFMPACHATQSTPLLLLAHSGPAAGSVFPLARGKHPIGRGPGNISLPDPGMSREHAVIEVSSTSVTLTQVDKSRPLLMNERPTQRARLTPGATFRCGSTSFSVVTDNSPGPELPAEAGQSVEAALEVTYALAPRNVLAIALAAAMPVVMGVGLAVVSGTWLYLGLSAMSAVSLLVPLISRFKSRREFRTAVARAVEDDKQRRRRTAPSAADILIAVRSRKDRARHGGGPRFRTDNGRTAIEATGSQGSSSRQGGGLPTLWVRLGMGPALANLRLVPDRQHFQAPSVGSAALTLDPRFQYVILRGRPEHTDALIRFIVMQLACFGASAGSPVIILGPAGRLPLPARFLPRTCLTTTPSAALARLQQWRNGKSGHLIIFDDASQESVQGLATLLETAHLSRWRVIRGGSPPSQEAVLTAATAVVEISLSGTSAALVAAGQHHHFIPDLIPEGAFEKFCRMLGGTDQARSTDDGGIPRRCSLARLRPLGQRSILRRWNDGTAQKGLHAILGCGREGRVEFDFGSDGPHLLVAGTTGSGKSELLRSLVVSLALNHPPGHATFLFFDFKGGSALRPLAELPHCLGLLTDLSEHQLDRALVSLRAEIRHREEMFVAAAVSDLIAYQQATVLPADSLPHLVIVIDEFRMLVDEAPNALRELMRVATVGRSLGIHLVMATQRPQGALTADIRANVTSSIALRVQTEMESIDIINAKSAASIDVGTPGRAYLAKGSSSPVEFQGASLAVRGGDITTANPRRADKPVVRNAAKALEQPWDRPLGFQTEAEASDSGTRAAVAAIHEAWNRLGLAPPRPPVQLPLPPSVQWHDTVDCRDTADRQPRPVGSAADPAAEWLVGPLGLLDIPNRQRVDPLLWSPSGHGHVAMIGGASSGMQSCFRAVAAMVATQEPKPHIYILDATGLVEGSMATSVGSAASVHQLPTAARILTLLSAEMEHRRTRGEDARKTPPLVLIIAGWCSWASAMRAGSFTWAEGIVQDIVRDGTQLGITVLISGERELASARFLGLISNRAYFPLGSSEESRYHWPRLPRLEPLPGRAVVFGGFVPEQAAVAQFRASPDEGRWPYGLTTSARPPFRVRPLPELLTVKDFAELFNGTAAQEAPDRLSRLHPTRRGPHGLRSSAGLNESQPLWIGVGGDESLPVSLPLAERGVSLILGGRGSGKSSILETLRALNPKVSWVFPVLGRPAGAFWVDVAQDSDAGLLDPGSVLLVDDVDLMDPTARRAIAVLAGKAHGIVMTAGSGPAVLQQIPLAKEVQAGGRGIVLAPRSPLDGDPFGVRLMVDAGAPCGRGLLVEAARVTPFQAALA